MSRFRKSEKREIPSLNTSSLPDLIFTLLFFFMISTNLKDAAVKIKMELPIASQTEDMKDESTNLNIYIGTGVENQDEEKIPLIFIDNSKIGLQEFPEFIQKKYTEKVRKDVIVTLKADKLTPMGMIIDIKKMLQNEGIHKIQYVAKP